MTYRVRTVLSIVFALCTTAALPSCAPATADSDAGAADFGTRSSPAVVSALPAPDLRQESAAWSQAADVAGREQRADHGEAARATFARALAVSGATARDSVDYAWALAVSHLYDGDFAAAERALAGTLRAARGRGGRWTEAVTHGRLAIIAGAFGDRAAVPGHVAAAWTAGDEAGATDSTYPNELAAYAHAFAGSPDSAAAYAERANAARRGTTDPAGPDAEAARSAANFVRHMRALGRYRAGACGAAAGGYQFGDTVRRGPGLSALVAKAALADCALRGGDTATARRLRGGVLADTGFRFDQVRHAWARRQMQASPLP
jgi:hypothetical protein